MLSSVTLYEGEVAHERALVVAPGGMHGGPVDRGGPRGAFEQSLDPDARSGLSATVTLRDRVRFLALMDQIYELGAPSGWTSAC